MSDHEKTRLLPVELTHEERATKALQLATACQDIALAEEKAKIMAGEAKAAIKVLESDRDALAGCVRTGKEYRAVDVYKRMNLSLRTWEIRRTDTLEIVESKAMTEWEYRDATQVKMPFAEGGQRVDAPSAKAVSSMDTLVDTFVDKVRSRLPPDIDAPGGQEIPAPKPAKPLTSTIGEATTPTLCINANCKAPITNPSQARKGRCGACAKHFRFKGEERPRKGPLVVDDSARASVTP